MMNTVDKLGTGVLRFVAKRAESSVKWMDTLIGKRGCVERKCSGFGTSENNGGLLREQKLCRKLEELRRFFEMRYCCGRDMNSCWFNLLRREGTVRVLP